MLLEPQPRSLVKQTEPFAVAPVPAARVISYHLPVDLSVMPGARKALQKVGLPENIPYTRVAAVTVKPSSPFGRIPITTPSGQKELKRGVSMTLVEAQTSVLHLYTVRMERRSFFGLPIGPVVEIKSRTNVTRF